MFFKYIRNQWNKGNIQIGLPTAGHGNKVSVLGSGLQGLAAFFLSSEEKQQLMSSRMSYGERLGPEYGIVGITDSERYPYVNGLKSLKEAVNVAVNYPILEPNGACTRIKRNFNFRSLDNPKGHVSGLSHEWYVFPNGSIVLSRKLVGSKKDLDDWLNHLPSPPKSMKPVQSLASELWDLECIALELGYKEAHSQLFKARWSRRRW